MQHAKIYLRTPKKKEKKKTYTSTKIKTKQVKIKTLRLLQAKPTWIIMIITKGKQEKIDPRSKNTKTSSKKKTWTSTKIKTKKQVKIHALWNNMQNPLESSWL